MTVDQVISNQRRIFRDTCLRWPAVEHAPRPGPITGRSPPSDDASEWRRLVDDFAAGVYTLPQAESRDGLIPIQTTGFCLDPLIRDRTRLWVDPQRTPVDRDFIWLIPDGEAAWHNVQSVNANPEWLKVYGASMRRGFALVKWLRHAEGEWRLIQNEGSGRDLLPDDRVLGTVVHIEEN